MPKNSSVQVQLHIEMAAWGISSSQCFTIIVFLIEAVLANNPIAINTNTRILSWTSLWSFVRKDSGTRDRMMSVAISMYAFVTEAARSASGLRHFALAIWGFHGTAIGQLSTKIEFAYPVSVAYHPCLTALCLTTPLLCCLHLPYIKGF